MLYFVRCVICREFSLAIVVALKSYIPQEASGISVQVVVHNGRTRLYSAGGGYKVLPMYIHVVTDSPESTPPNAP